MPATAHLEEEAFRHEAFMYAGQDEFLAGMTPFIQDSLEAQEPILVVVGAAKIEGLRAELGADAADVHFADMSEVGSNPARIIPAWRDFVDSTSAPGRPLRGIGEPIGPDRWGAELVECHRHESLLNLAFVDTPGFWLLCPYDTDAVDPAVIHEARRNHPFVVDGGAPSESANYGGIQAALAPFTEPLDEPPGRPPEITFEADTLSAMRRFVSLHAADAGIGLARTKDLVLAVSEVATNSVRHADGRGRMRIWEKADAVICEVLDSGRIDYPLAGRERPGPDQVGGYGLWLANQLCDLVQVRSVPAGSAVRLHMRRG